MTFASADFVGLMAVVLAVYWFLPLRGQNVLLTVASLLFYGWIEPRWVLLLLYSAVLDFGAGQGIARFPARRNLFLAASIVGNGGLLGAFKYYGFFVDNVTAAFSAVGVHVSAPTLSLVLPAGLSFYTFQTLSYTIDVYRGRLPPCRSFPDFLLFVSFFPQLVAGPISRARDLLPQLASPRTFSVQALREGFGLAVWGGFKKVVLADTLAPYVATAFGADAPSGPMIWTAAFAGTVGLFADFSGYSDIARGTARMLGVTVARNFDAPMLARSPAEWWTRWHITLMDWIRDYIFHPLVLSPWCRRWLVIPFVAPSPDLHVVRGVYGALLFSGLWHGADWHYLMWGGGFATVQVAWWFVERRIPLAVRDTWRVVVIQRALMVVVVLVSGVVYQERDLGRLARTFTISPLGGDAAQWLAASILFALTVSAMAPMVARWAIETRWTGRESHPAWLPLQTTTWCLLCWAIAVFAQGSSDFEYFQF